MKIKITFTIGRLERKAIAETMFLDRLPTYEECKGFFRITRHARRRAGRRRLPQTRLA